MGKPAGPEDGPEALDRELADLPPDLRWREWLRRIEAVLFATASPVPAEELARVVGRGAAVDLLVADLRAETAGRAWEVARVGRGWMLRTRPAYAAAVRAAADADGQDPGLTDADMEILAAVAHRQPVTRAALGEMFGRTVGRERIGRLRERGLVAPGPRSPEPGAPIAWVTTERFLAVFGLESLRDLDMSRTDGASE